MSGLGLSNLMYAHITHELVACLAAFLSNSCLVGGSHKKVPHMLVFFHFCAYASYLLTNKNRFGLGVDIKQASPSAKVNRLQKSAVRS